MTTVNAITTAAPAWQASRAKRPLLHNRWEKNDDGELALVLKVLMLYYVVLERLAGGKIIYSVSWPKPHEQLVFSDSRESSTGIAGSTGLWGTRSPAKPGGKRRTMNPRVWKQEVCRFISGEEADRIVAFYARRPDPDQGKLVTRMLKKEDLIF